MKKIFNKKTTKFFKGAVVSIILIFIFSACETRVETESENQIKTSADVAKTIIENEKAINIDSNLVDEDANLNLFPSAVSYEQSGKGRFALANIANFVLLSESEDLAMLTLTVGEELISKGIVEGNTLISVDDENDFKKSDIILSLEDNIEGNKNKEAFSIEIGDKIFIKANSSRAAMYALRAIEQYIYAESSMPYGKIVDYPESSVRALHLDMGRKYFEPEWIKARIRDMSRARLNTLQLHFSEHEGFRIECETYPEIMSDKYITKDEMRRILDEAKMYGVDIVPAFDNPGHLRQALKEHPEFWLEDVNGKKNKGSININNPQAREFVKNIISEYAELFSDSEYFHIGGDEFINFDKFDEYPSLAKYGQNFVDDGIVANGLDGYTAYINEIAEHVKSLGFKVRIWNDGVYRENFDSHVALDKDIEICYWTRWNDNMASTDALIEKGHKLINVNDMMYYVLTDAKIYATPPNAEHLYNNWHNGYFAGFDYEALQRYDMPNENILGSSYAIWCDHDEMQTQEEIAEGIFYSLRAMAEKSWGGQDKKRHEYKEWERLIDKYER